MSSPVGGLGEPDQAGIDHRARAGVEVDEVVFGDRGVEEVAGEDPRREVVDRGQLVLETEGGERPQAVACGQRLAMARLQSASHGGGIGPGGGVGLQDAETSRFPERRIGRRIVGLQQERRLVERSNVQTVTVPGVTVHRADDRAGSGLAQPADTFGENGRGSLPAGGAVDGLEKADHAVGKAGVVAESRRAAGDGPGERPARFRCEKHTLGFSKLGTAHTGEDIAPRRRAVERIGLVDLLRQDEKGLQIVRIEGPDGQAHGVTPGCRPVGGRRTACRRGARDRSGRASGACGGSRAAGSRRDRCPSTAWLRTWLKRQR